MEGRFGGDRRRPSRVRTEIVANGPNTVYQQHPPRRSPKMGSADATVVAGSKTPNPVFTGDQATAIPSTSTFHAGLLRPPTISVLAGR